MWLLCPFKMYYIEVLWYFCNFPLIVNKLETQQMNAWAVFKVYYIEAQCYFFSVQFIVNKIKNTTINARVVFRVPLTIENLGRGNTHGFMSFCISPLTRNSQVSVSESVNRSHKPGVLWTLSLHQGSLSSNKFYFLLPSCLLKVPGLNFSGNSVHLHGTRTSITVKSRPQKDVSKI